ncbi:hypothetical protein B7P43_G01020 [Cryptotermes secundus]|nr:hypothetical protein B7P43_G01020 [Cryptotermes secundus]
MKPAASGQMQETVGNKIEHQDREVGAKKPQLSRQSRDVIVSKQKTDTSRKYVKLKGRNGIVSDGFESGSSNKENDITNGEVRQPRSEHRVDDDTDNGGDLTRFIEGKCEEGIWGPFRNEVCNGQQKDNQHGTKKQGQKCKNHVPEPCINKGENKPENYMPEANGCRAQVQVEWNQKKGQIEVQEAHRDLNLFQPVPDAHRARREVVSQTYVPEASDGGTEGQVDWNQKRDEIEIQKGHKDQKLLGFLPGPSRNRRESMFHGCMPEADGSRAHEKSVAESWKVHGDHVPVSLAVGRGRPQEVNREQENCNSNNQNYVSRNRVYCSDEKLMTDKYNEWNGKKRQGDIWIDFVSQDADICRKEETSSFGRKEKLSKSEKGMIEHFPGKKSEDSGMCVCTSYDNKVQSDLGKCINKIESSADVNDNSYLQVHAEQSFNTNPVSLQNSPQNVRMLPTSCIRDIHLNQTCSPCVDSPGNASQVRHATNAFWPSMASTAGLFHGSDSLTTMAGIGSEPHAQHIPNQACESSSQPLLVQNIQELFEAFVQELQWHIMSTNQMHQMALVNSPGSRNMNPPGLPNSECNLKLQGQQINSVPVMAAPINPLGGLPTKSNDLLLQSHNALLNQSASSVLNPWLLGVNQVVAPSNVPIQPIVSSSCNRNGNTVQMPNSDMYSSGTVSPDPSVFQLNHASQANYPNIYLNNADNMPLDIPAFMLNRGTQANHRSCISPTGISPSYMMPQNYQSSQTYQPAVGSMQNTQQIAPIMYNQPLGVRPADEVTSSKMVIGKGRGRLLH